MPGQIGAAKLKEHCGIYPNDTPHNQLERKVIPLFQDIVEVITKGLSLGFSTESI